MKHRQDFRLCSFLLLLLALTLSTFQVQGMTYTPHTPPFPPRPPTSISKSQSATQLSRTQVTTADLKAVLLVGPIDGNSGEWTRSEIENMEKAATVLENQGVDVHCFYPGNSDFDQIKAAADGAHFLLYRGHGVYWSSPPRPDVGGFSLSSGMYSADDIRENLHLAPNAIVMLYGCFTAGSSSADWDLHDIGFPEATRRIAQYSDPFFDVGAAGYYANWFGDAFEQFLLNLYDGQTLGQAYQSYFDFNPDTVYQTSHPEHPDMVLWSDRDNWGYWKYNNAFAGKSDQTLESLFPTAQLGNVPDALSFSAQVGTQVSIVPQQYSVTPQNVGNDSPLSWDLSQQGDWFTLDRYSGTTPDTFRIVPQDFPTDRVGTYQGAITVTVKSPQDTRDAVQRIDLRLQVNAAELGGLPEALDFIYDIQTQTFINPAYTLTPRNVGNTETLSWEVETDVPWLDISPAQGHSPQSFTVAVQPPSSTVMLSHTIAIPGTAIFEYHGTLTATVTSPVYVLGSPQTISVVLRSVESFSNFQVFLPIIMR